MELLISKMVEVGVLVALAVLTQIGLMVRSWLKSKLGKDQYDLLDRLADSAVWAVEQRGPGIFSSKKDAARDIIEKELKERGLLGKFPGSTIDAVIESNVGQSFHYSDHVKLSE